MTSIENNSLLLDSGFPNGLIKSEFNHGNLKENSISTSSKPKALVIGAGFGGLASAIRLSQRGYDVEIIEKLDAPGGRAYVHQQDGFTFDAGPTIITAPFLLEELWDLCGKKCLNTSTCEK